MLPIGPKIAQREATDILKGPERQVGEGKSYENRAD
jgi:hypothetical protein